MTGFVMRPRVGAPRMGEITDTIKASEGSRTSVYKYVHGDARPHFPLPATLASADASISWAHLTRCGCSICIEQYMDSLEGDFPEAFDGT